MLSEPPQRNQLTVPPRACATTSSQGLPMSEAPSAVSARAPATMAADTAPASIMLVIFFMVSSVWSFASGGAILRFLRTSGTSGHGSTRCPSASGPRRRRGDRLWCSAIGSAGRDANMYAIPASTFQLDVNRREKNGMRLIVALVRRRPSDLQWPGSHDATVLPVPPAGDHSRETPHPASPARPAPPDRLPFPIGPLPPGPRSGMRLRGRIPGIGGTHCRHRVELPELRVPVGPWRHPGRPGVCRSPTEIRSGCRTGRGRPGRRSGHGHRHRASPIPKQGNHPAVSAGRDRRRRGGHIARHGSRERHRRGGHSGLPV